MVQQYACAINIVEIIGEKVVKVPQFVLILEYLNFHLKFEIENMAPRFTLSAHKCQIL